MKYLLKDVSERLNSGKNIKSKDIFETGQFPVYGGNGLRGYTNTSNFKGECVLIGRQGEHCGNVRYFSGEGYITEHAIILTAKKEFNTKYLFNLLSLYNLRRLSGQSAQPGLSVETLGNQKIDLPSFKEQSKIGELLFLIDQQIELNSKINDNLAA